MKKQLSDREKVAKRLEAMLSKLNDFREPILDIYKFTGLPAEVYHDANTLLDCVTGMADLIIEVQEITENWGSNRKVVS
jgi:hypothetical protein